MKLSHWVIALTLLPQSLWAKDFFVEPYVGVSKMQVLSDGTYDVANGFFLGGKLGLNFGKQYFIGADYHTAGPYNFHAPLGETEWNTKMIGGGLGADYKVIRFWVGYYPTDEHEDSLSGGKLKGYGVKVGFGLKINNKLRANLSLIFHEIDEVEINGLSAEREGLSAESANVSISVPIDL